MDEDLKPVLWPIIYVRGYAMSEGERDDTTADPFCGFNLGSTVYRATTDRHKAQKLVFESPLVRLATEYDYCDVYEDGLDIVDEDWKRSRDQKRCLARNSVVIYRYYDEGSTLLGDGKPRPILEYAKGLATLIENVRNLVCANEDDPIPPDKFKCYLVAHSMGGLVVRTFLQNNAASDPTLRACVDKVFTYATPHNGIDMAGINIPRWLSLNDMNNFNRKEMADYLDLKPLFAKTDRVDWMEESYFPSDRFFCMVGSNRADYSVARGASRTFAGQGSDGLVRIENARVWGVTDTGEMTHPCATAYAYRSHSGYFGIVNSEEAYQNLARFLFGDVRADVWLDIDTVTLPDELKDKEPKVNAVYQIEFLAAPKGKRWYLTRRVAEEDSVACKTREELKAGMNSSYLSSIFLSKRARVNRDIPTLSYAAELRIRVPDYEVDRKFWFDGHYEGGYLFSDRLIVVVTLEETLSVHYGWYSADRDEAPHQAQTQTGNDGKIHVVVPVMSRADVNPRIEGKLRFDISPWNNWHR